MTSVFADSYFYLALLNPRDVGHDRAKTVAKDFQGRIFTSQWVLTEVADAMCRESNRHRFIRFFETIAIASTLSIVAADASHFMRGMNLYRKRLDKSWSLTDCTSFVIMHDLGLTEAFTADAHFEQAGFAALLRE
jgi:uncharacterized protein